MEIPQHLTCLLKNLYVSQEATVRTGHGTMDWLKIGKEVHEGCILSPCLFNYVHSISWEMPGWWSTSWNQDCQEKYNHRYAGDTTLMAESKEELQSLLMKVKEESEKAGLKCNIQKTKNMASSLITSWQIDGGTKETVIDYLLGLKNHCRWWLQPWN